MFAAPRPVEETPTGDGGQSSLMVAGTGATSATYAMTVPSVSPATKQGLLSFVTLFRFTCCEARNAVPYDKC